MKPPKLLSLFLSLALIFIWSGSLMSANYEDSHKAVLKNDITKSRVAEASLIKKCSKKLKQFIILEGQAEKHRSPAPQPSVNHDKRNILSESVPTIANKSPPVAS